jgi:hypothetical protein
MVEGGAAVDVESSARTIALTYNYLTGSDLARGLYYGGGAGVNWIQVENEWTAKIQSGSYTGTMNGSDEESYTKLSIHGIEGYSFSKAFGVEARYNHFLGDIDGVSVSGVAVSAIGRF